MHLSCRISILAAKQLLEEGLIGKIVNGESVKIGQNKWIPKQSSFRIQTLVSLLDEDHAKLK